MKRFFRRHALWLGFAAVLLPLGMLLSMQYVWLHDLQEMSAVAEKAYLKNYLESVSSKVEYYYRRQAERGLNLPAYVFLRDSPDKVEVYFAKKTPEGARRLFAVNFVNDKWKPLLVFDPESEEFGEPTDPEMARAIRIALAPWKMASNKGSYLPAAGISVEEKDSRHRIILNPITDDGCRVLGVAGMIVDTEHFKNVVLPEAIDTSLPKFFDEGAKQNLIITVRDHESRLVQATERPDQRESQVTGRIPFIFSDWELALGSRHTTPEEWAQSNFVLNISLSALLALALVAGMFFALRVASRQVRLSRMKSDFVSNVSHELRTPLASIRVFGELLRLGKVRDPQKSREYGEFIETESRRLTQLINNILDFSKIESGAKTYELEPRNVEQLVDDTLKTLEVSLKHRGFKLTVSRPSRPLPLVAIDSDSIAQAVANLVDNAAKYSGEAKEIGVSLDSREDELTISVRDSGIGISKSEQSKIFERFHRVSTGLVHDVKGSGLGLSIVSHIVRAHRGTVSVKSEPGRGSTFTIHLPLQSSVASENSSASATREILSVEEN